MPRLARSIALALLLPFVLAGCGPEGTLRTDGVTFTAVPRTPMPTATATPTPTPTAAPPGEIVVAFVGDLMLDRDIETAMETEGVEYPLGRTQELFAGSDLVIGNLEGTLTDVGTPMQKQFTFATSPELAGGLSPFWAVSLANNHATDYGLAGLERTIEVLNSERIAWWGAGTSEAEARAPVIGTAAGTPRIAYLGYSDVGETLHASGAQGGVSRAGLEEIAQDVAALRARVDIDFIVVTLHGGTEYDHAPTDRQRELARAAIDAGANLVVGHHPHVLQPVEEYNGGLILYSLGNFVFDLDADDLETLGEGPFQSVVALVTFRTGEPPALELRPARIDVDENRPRAATPDEAEAILALLQPPQ